MRYGLFSDVHSNLEALQAVLAAMEMEKVEKYLCLGDVIGYAANPNECLNQIRQLPLIAVAGNHDLAAVGHPIIDELHNAAREAVEWTIPQLTEENKAWIRTLPLVAQEGEATLVHGSLVDPEKFHYILSQEEIAANLDLMQTLLCFVGHSHHPWMMEEGAGKKCLINVGSVGQPRDGDNRASFCVWDSETRRIQLKRIAYDIESVQRKILAAGLPSQFAERLEVGK